MNLDFIDMLDGYKAENDELLQKMEDALMQIQEEGMNDENINAVFRAAHTIKGSSGMFGIDYIVEFTHIAENLLDKIRNHKIPMSGEIIELLLACKDQMQILINFVMSDPEGHPDEDIKSDSKRLINELQAHLDGNDNLHVEETVEIVELIEINEYQIKIDFASDTFSHGFDTYTFINFLHELGEIKNIQTDTESIPIFTDINPSNCYMSYIIDVHSSKDSQELEAAFDFVKEGSTVSVIDLSESKQKPEPVKTIEKKREIQIEGSKAKNTPQAVKQTNFIRIEASKVDSLINLIGEMVISNASVMQHAANLRDSELIESVSTVTRMLEEVRENAMQIRMVPIGETFNKFKRIVHDTANKVGKKVDLIINGGDTELDKTVIEKIADPLVHLIRNSIDHGIETPDVREAFGKSITGVLHLNAYHDAGSIAIEIIDDGKGLDAEVLLRKGIEKGLIDEQSEPTQKEIFDLILQAGFSTAEKVSDISGRGVGMDVVKRNISDLHGGIEIESEKSKGTKVTIRLPLTLAIIDGFLTKVGNTHIIIPLDMLVECIELNKKTIAQMHNNSYINLRGRVLPLLNISTYFKIPHSDTARSNVIVIQYAGQRMGIIVDELLGELQTVIKPMGQLFNELKYFSGSTILGSGEVALIMDIQVMLQMMESKQKKELVA
ncbi:chemotaxis protein CheA [Candidatus Sulfurimonas marisnigri]|uniref:Chemotaxis protein CheA n=1 Tax=Candidatus Sulfurimonas marisnigri TaxID=2740405 RepID=A0A7S7M194_9BACT|nr:chemotaxis protein CheA [Candidatus Sulfurimonas marisnigri]QOY55292.1 chemotaxis protein CheA [Candidatus Sulfurimonas marisnigri]